jgi:hypothetical protein
LTVQVSVLNRDKLFSYETQYTTVHKAPLVWKDGDQLSTACVYDSAARSTNTSFGLKTNDEMCLHAHLVFPANCGAFHVYCIVMDRRVRKLFC